MNIEASLRSNSPNPLVAKSGRHGERILNFLFFACASISVITTVAVIVILAVETYGFFQQVSVSEFLFGTQWTPLLEPKSYGILPLLSGTFLIVAGSAMVALPVGLACAIYLSEYASEKTRSFIKPVLEVLVISLY